MSEERVLTKLIGGPYDGAKIPLLKSDELVAIPLTTMFDIVQFYPYKRMYCDDNTFLWDGRILNERQVEEES